jgi:hypothetical protein
MPSGEPHLATRLYLSVACHELERDQTLPRRLEELCRRLDVACVNLELPLASEPDVAALVHRLQELGIAVLAGIDQIALMATAGGPDLEALGAQLAIARRLGCDGVHLPGDERLFAPARASLPADAIIGAQCAGSRHQAMVFGELGADYVAFAGASDQVLDLVAWWQELFEVPCVAWHVADVELLDGLLRLPADFIGLAPTLWDDEAAIGLLAGHCAQSHAAS